VGVEFSGSEVAESLEEDSKGVADGDCADVGVDDDNVDKLVTLTVDDEFVASVIVNSIISKIQRNPRSILVMKTGKRSLRCLLTDQNGKKKKVPLQLVSF